MDNASKIPCDVVYAPKEEKYAENIRNFQGCPTLAVTHGGRIYMGWYAGGTREPHMENYNLLIYSDDDGETWSETLLVIPSSKERLVHALDIELWCAPDGKLFVFWVQNNTELISEGDTRWNVDGYVFPDRVHAEWFITCDEPDAETPTFSAPRYMDRGFLRSKPTVLSDGSWFFCNYAQASDGYDYSLSDDGGKTFSHHSGAKKIDTSFDETMVYQKKNGDIRMMARCKFGEIAETTSCDMGKTWSEAKFSGITHADTRFFVSRTESGRIILIYNDHPKDRTNMTLALSEDDGETWKYKRCIDTRGSISYPDSDFHNGKIYLTYDRERTGAKEILFTSFTENDIIDESRQLEIKIVSKP